MWLAVLSAFAAPVAFRAHGEVFDVQDPLRSLDPGVTVGLPFQITWSYDDLTSDIDTRFDWGTYPFDVPEHRVQVDVGPYLFRSHRSAPDNDIAMVSQPNLDIWQVSSLRRSEALTTSPRIAVQDLVFRMEDYTGALLPNTSLSQPIPSPRQWTQHHAWANALLDWSITADIRSMRPVPYLVVTGGVGSATLTASGLTPRGTVVLVTGAPGAFTVPGGRCAGSFVALDQPSVQVTLGADANGALQIQFPLPQALSGEEMVAFDLASCTPSVTATLP